MRGDAGSNPALDPTFFFHFRDVFCFGLSIIVSGTPAVPRAKRIPIRIQESTLHTAGAREI